MPQLIFLALAGVGAYATYRWVSKQVRQSRTVESASARQDGEAARDLGALQRDPETGEYRPRS